MWDISVHQLPPHLPQSASHHLVMHPCHPRLPSPLLLLVWMTVSSLTTWFSDFHTVQFSGSYGCYFSFLVCFFLFVFVFNCFSSKVVSIFPVPFPTTPLTLTFHPQSYPSVALSMSLLYMFLDQLSSSFPCYSPPPAPLVTISLFFISMSLVIFCLLV